MIKKIISLLYFTCMLIYTNAQLNNSSRATQQTNLQILNIAQTQLREIKQYQHLDSQSRSKIFIDSIYNPYKEFWNRCLGDDIKVLKWLNKNITKIDEWEIKNLTVNANLLNDKFLKWPAICMHLLVLSLKVFGTLCMAIHGQILVQVIISITF